MKVGVMEYFSTHPEGGSSCQILSKDNMYIIAKSNSTRLSISINACGAHKIQIRSCCHVLIRDCVLW